MRQECVSYQVSEIPISLSTWCFTRSINSKLQPPPRAISREHLHRRGGGALGLPHPHIMQVLQN